MPQISAQVRHLCISAEQAGQRVDNFLIRELRNVPRSHIYRLLRSGQVRVNGGRVKPTRKLREGDDLRVPPVRDVGERNQHRVPDQGREEVLQSVLHEDDSLIVLNKPAGWAVHAGSGVPYGIIDALRQARRDLSYLELAHRLDRETSGCLLLAKSRHALEELHDGFRNHDPQGGHEKHYLTLLSGELSKGSQLVTLPLASQRLESGERMVQVDRHDGRAAHSEFELLEHIAGQSLVRVRIMTGRMHQIRVHAQSLGHPVLADRKYGERAANQAIRRYGLKRMFLHAERIRLQFQGGERIFAATLPKDLEHVLETLRNAS